MSDLPCGFSPTKARGKRPVPMWADRFLRDTLELSAEEIGAYHLILYAMWKRPDCSLPLDPRKLARIARVSLRKWNSQVGPAILELMDVDADVLTSKKLTEEARQTEDWCTTQHGRKCEVCKKRRVYANNPDTPSSGKDNEENPDKSLETNDPPLTGDTTGDEPGNYPGINHPNIPTYKTDDDAGARDLPDNLFPDGGNSSDIADGPRERILEAIGADPTSGIVGPNGTMLGTASDMLEFTKWKSDLALTDDQISDVVADVMARNRNAGRGPPKSFRYFTDAMAEFAAARDRPMPQPDPARGGHRNGKSSFTADIHDLSQRLSSGEVELSTASRDPWSVRPGGDDGADYPDDDAGQL